VLNLANGERWNLPTGCAPVAATKGALLTVCTQKSTAGTSRAILTKIATDGAARRLRPIRLVWRGDRIDSAFLSPDGRFVLAHDQPNCGIGLSYLFSTTTGKARVIPVPGNMRASEPAGWSTDGRAVISSIDATSDCGEGTNPSIYLVSPKTLRLTKVYSAAFVPMWNPAG
jgi:hypothetical protein